MAHGVVGEPVSIPDHVRDGPSPELALTGPFMPVPVTQTLRPTIETLLIAGTGGVLFDLAKFPAGWLAGAMVLTATAALVGRPLGLPDNLARAFYIVLGMSIGAVATPQTVAGMAIWPLSIVAVTIAMGVGTFGTFVYLKRVHGWDTLTAVLGGSRAGSRGSWCWPPSRARPAGDAIVQSMRVVILAVCVPAGLGLFGLAGPVRLPAGSVAILDAPQISSLVGLSVAVAPWRSSRVFRRADLRSMVVSGILHGGDFPSRFRSGSPTSPWWAWARSPARASPARRSARSWGFWARRSAHFSSRSPSRRRSGLP
jgi:hypothetical protein